MLERVVHFFLFSLRYTDGDQTLMWVGAMEMGKGLFYEPAFYGQSYNTMLEGFLAVPLHWLHMPVNAGTALMSSVLGILPYIVLSVYFYRRGFLFAALTMLALPLMLPTEFTVLTSIPRGFVTGIALACFVFILIQKPGRRNIFFAGLLSALSFSINPNSVLFIAFCFFLIAQDKEMRWKHLLAGLAGAAFGLSYFIFVKWFYYYHPESALHTGHDLYLDPASFISGLKNLPDYFTGLAPFSDLAGFMIIPGILFCAWILYRKKVTRPALAYLLLFFFVVFCFFIKKVHDGTASVFFPYSRMFLALPLLAGLVTYFLEVRRVVIKENVKRVFIIVTILAFIVKMIIMPERIARIVKINSGIVDVARISRLKTRAQEIGIIARKNNAHLLVFCRKNDLLDYSLPVLMEGSIQTIAPNYERRTWIMKEQMPQRRNENVVLCNEDPSLQQQLMNAGAVPVPGDTSLLIFYFKNRSLEEFLGGMNMPFRNYLASEKDQTAPMKKALLTNILDKMLNP
jgi:hypothetical protein